MSLERPNVNNTALLNGPVRWQGNRQNRFAVRPGFVSSAADFSSLYFWVRDTSSVGTPQVTVGEGLIKFMQTPQASNTGHYVGSAYSSQETGAVVVGSLLHNDRIYLKLTWYPDDADYEYGNLSRLALISDAGIIDEIEQLSDSGGDTINITVAGGVGGDHAVAVELRHFEMPLEGYGFIRSAIDLTDTRIATYIKLATVTVVDDVVTPTQRHVGALTLPYPTGYYGRGRTS